MHAPALTRRSALALAAAAALALAACDRGGADAAEGEMAIGSANAPVTMVEYASTTCNHCAAWDRDVWPAFKRKYVDTGQVRYVFREMLTPPNEVAAAGFLVARCAGRDRYFDVVHALFRGQEEMARTGDVRGVLLRTAQSAGMTEERFNQCVSDEDALVAMNARIERDARRDGVTGTPTFVIGATKLVGPRSLAELDAAIQPLLKTRRGG